MRRRSFRVWLAGIFVLACFAGGLAVVSAVHAGGVTNLSTFDLFVQPSALNTSSASKPVTGFAKGVFTAASGSGTGSATHVMITFRVPAALSNPSGTSSDCSVAGGSGVNVVTCNVGTVNAGQTVKRFVTFTAPSSLVLPQGDRYDITGSVQWDNGSSGAGGRGGISSLEPKTASTTVYSATDFRHAGNCFLSGSGTVSTPPVSSKDNQATSAQVGAAAPSLGLPCTFAEVGEDHVAGFDTDISHDTIPQLSQPAKITLTLNSLPVKFEVFFWRFLPDYPDTQLQLPIPSCDDNGQLPTNEAVCLLSSAKKGSGGTWTFLQRGTDGDPAYGH